MNDFNRFKTKFENKEKALDYLGGKCIKCGETKILNLEFDHIDPTTKLYNITEILHYKWENILKELNKCQILCVKCHMNKTKPWKRKAIHGTNSMYQNQKCRCELCSDAHYKYHLEYEERKKYELY